MPRTPLTDDEKDARRESKKAARSAKHARTKALIDADDRVKGMAHVPKGKFIHRKQVEPRWTLHDGDKQDPLTADGHLILISSPMGFGARTAAKVFMSRLGAPAALIERLQVMPFYSNGQLFSRVVLVTKPEKETAVTVERFDFDLLRREAADAAAVR